MTGAALVDLFSRVRVLYSLCHESRIIPRCRAPPVVLKELNLRGVIAYRRSEFQEAIDLLAAGRIPTD